MHPAEAAADMKADPVLAGELLARGDRLPAHYGGGPPEIPAEPLRRAAEPPEAPRALPPPEGHPWSLDAARAHLDERLSVGEAPADRKLTWSRFYSWTVDRLYPIREQVGENAYQASRLYAGWTAKADAWVNNGTRDFMTNAKVGDSLRSIISDVRTDLDEFRRFATAARALELDNRGVATGVERGAAEAIVQAGRERYGNTMLRLVNYQNELTAYLRDSGVLSRAGYDAMVEANKLFMPFHRVMELEPGKRIEAVGGSMTPHNPVRMIDGSERRIVDPIESVLKNTFLLINMAERNTVATKIVDTLRGLSESRELVPVGRRPDALPADVRTFLRENNAPASLEGVLRDMNTPMRDGEIRVYRDGRAEIYRVPEDVAVAVKNLDAASVGIIERMLAPLAGTLRSGAMLNPEFAARHLIREPFTAALTFTRGFLSPVQTVKGLKHVIAKDDMFWDFMSSGAGHTSLVALDRNYMQLGLEELQGRTGIMTRAWNVVADPNTPMGQKAMAALGVPFEAAGRYIIHPLQVAVEAVTTATKMGAYEKVYHLNRAEAERGVRPTDQKALMENAAWVARETGQDNARMGAKMRALNMVTVFLNARIQDADSLVRAAKNQPGQFALVAGAGITLPSLLLWYANKDDQRYQDLPNWQKDLFWIVPTDNWVDVAPADQTDLIPDHLLRKVVGKDGVARVQRNDGVLFRIPKPFTAGIVFGSGAERAAQALFDRDPAAFRGFFNTVKEAVIGDFTPTAIAPVLEQARNRGNLSGQAIIPKSLENQLPEYQYTPYTSETAKALGMVISSLPGIDTLRTQDGTFAGGVAAAMSSPILIENYIRGWTGTLGMYAFQAADYGLRKAGVVKQPVNPAEKTWSDIPFVKAFVARYPGMGAEPIQHFYDNFETADRYWKTWEAQAQKGNLEAVERVQRLGGSQMLSRLEGVKEGLGVVGRTIQMVNDNPDVLPGEKRQLIDGMYYSMIQMAREGVAAQRMIKQEAEK